jgi:hypothetical protein
MTDKVGESEAQGLKIERHSRSPQVRVRDLRVEVEGDSWPNPRLSNLEEGVPKKAEISQINTGLIQSLD